ncbi:MAG: hypothetical protein QOJ69_221, partial [Actinomycetota bacterium]|nr:hypothetical protein [Actinomycetota bacterium]
SAAGQGVLPTGTLAGDEDPTGDSCLTTQVVRFAGIGVASTIAFALLFLLLAGPLGALAADVVALGACAIGNLVANRRVTFAQRGRYGRARQYRAGLAVAALPLGLTVVTLLGLEAAGITSTATLLLVVTAANAVATAARFLLLRHWVFGPRSKGTPMDSETRTSLPSADTPARRGGFWHDGPPDDDLYGPSPWAARPAVVEGDGSTSSTRARIAAVVGAVVIVLGTAGGVRAATSHDAVTSSDAGTPAGGGNPGRFGPAGGAPGSVPRVPR